MLDSSVKILTKSRYHLENNLVYAVRHEFYMLIFFYFFMPWCKRFTRKIVYMIRHEFHVSDFLLLVSSYHTRSENDKT